MRSAEPRQGLCTVILAAGGSRRLGQPKQLVKLKGEPLVLRALRGAQEATPGRVVLVLGAHGLRIRALLRRRAHGPTVLVDNGRWREGMASSLQRGLRALPADCRAALLLLVDQPGVTGQSLERLIRGWLDSPGRLAAARYGDRLGVPAIIPRRYWGALTGLAGDAGARSLLRRNAAAALGIPMPEAAWDVDEPGDLAGL